METGTRRQMDRVPLKFWNPDFEFKCFVFVGDEEKRGHQVSFFWFIANKTWTLPSFFFLNSL